MKKPTIEKAVKALEKFIKENWGEKPPDTVKVYHFNSRGFRIAEISSTWGKLPSISGCSWMRCECPQAILAAEEFVLTFGIKPYRPKGWESDIDSHGEACDMLAHLMK